MATGIGDTLREAREHRGLSLEDAASETRIRVTHLAALEREEFGQLGGDVYARGFIRSYARAVGLDPEPLLENHSISPPPTPAEAPATPLGQEPLERNAPRRGLGFAAAGLALAAIVGLALWGGGSSDRVEMADDPFGGIDVDGEPADDDGSAELPDPTPTPTPTATPTNPPDTATDGGRSEPAQEERVTLEVVEREVWVRALVDGEEVWQDLLARGRTETFDEAGEIRLRLGDAGAVELTVAGRSIGAPGSDGQPVWVTIAPDDEVSVR